MKKIIETKRGTFNVRCYGDNSHPPIILLHGFPQSSIIWHHVAPFLKGYFVIAPDLRGMGDSNRSLEIELYEKDEMAKDMFAIADELGIQDFYLGGHDWGGAIVQEMVFLNPKRIKKLIIMNMIIMNNKKGLAKAEEVLIPQMFRSSWYWFLMSIKKFPEALISGKEEVWVRFFSRGISNPIPEESIQEFIRCYKIPGTITTTANIYRTMPKDRKRWKTFEGKIVDIPTNIIHGVLDPVIIQEYIFGVEEYFSDLKVTKLNGGHFIVDEQPQAVGEAIQKFLKE